MSRCSILRRVTVIGNVTVSAKTKFLVVALENVAMFHFVEGISKGVPLRHAFRIFPRERKDTAVWSAQLHEREIC